MFLDYATIDVVHESFCCGNRYAGFIRTANAGMFSHMGGHGALVYPCLSAIECSIATYLGRYLGR